MTTMKLIVLQVEGGGAEIAAACDFVCKQLAVDGKGAQPSAGTDGARPAVILQHTPEARKDAQSLTAHPETKPKARCAPTGAARRNDETPRGAVQQRILRYLAESRENGEPDCTIDEVFRLSGAASPDAAKTCLHTLKKRGLADIGSKRGLWRITDAGVAALSEKPPAAD